METLRTCGDSASLQKYVTRQLLDTSGFFKDPSFDQSRAHGTRYLMLARMDALWTARKAIQIGILVDTHPFSADHCILCDQQLLSTSIAHLVVECEQLLLLTVAPPKVVPVAEAKSTIMISYNRKYQPQARLIHHILEANGFIVWRDEQDMKTDIVDSMAKAVSSSHVVLVLVSRSYRESSNCQMECKFAHNNNRKLIPVLMEDGYDFKADGWLGLLLGSKLFYDASKCGINRTQLETVMQMLLAREVEDHAAGGAITKADEEEPTRSKLPAPQNAGEIRQWLSKHKHGEEIADRLEKEGLVEAEDLELLSHKSSTELKSFLELNGKQVLVLETALGELF
ncbi:hypothetical protein BASA81_004971 [Batrachochytrium salamandrivorans]|nr:hypothetical protein BASA81_004971 [Batrachochytrium salamandrivorans]